MDDSAHELANWFFTHSCACGRPEDVAGLMLDVLTVLESWDNRDRLEELLPGRTYYTVLNYYDKIGLLEHGGSISRSWLTETGEAILSALRKHGVDPEDWGEHCSASSDGRCECGQAVPTE